MKYRPPRVGERNADRRARLAPVTARPFAAASPRNGIGVYRDRSVERPRRESAPARGLLSPINIPPARGS
jgi:hypothetical protein